MPYGRKHLRRGMLRVLVDAIDLCLLPVMMFKLATDHFHIGVEWLMPPESVGSRVHSYKPFAGLDPIEKRLLIREREIARGVGENDGIIISKRCRTHFFGEDLADGGLDFIGVSGAVC